jgi:HD-GYP domain-containing protein (c-di-GMP phosphodiesterase class II)
MAELAAMLARRMGLAQPDINAIFEAALLHDIGLYAMSPAYHSSPARALAP